MRRRTAALAGLLLLTACGQAQPVNTSAPDAAEVSADPVTAVASDRVRLDVRRTPVAGGRIAWAELGSGSPLVLLNGTASPMAEWDPALLSALAARHRVIVMDYPGLGGSTALRRKLTFDRLADVVAEWLQRIDVTEPAVLGWSMGTFVTQRLAVRHPASASKVILVAGNPGGRRTTLGPEWVQRADSDPNYTTRTYLRTNYPDTTCARRAGRAFLRRQAAAVESGRYPAGRVPEPTYDAMVAAEDPWLRSDRNLRQLRRVTLPTLVMVGAGDVITPPANSRVLARGISGAALQTISGSGHSVLFQEPLAFAGLVQEFLAGSVPAGQRRSIPGNCG